MYFNTSMHLCIHDEYGITFESLPTRRGKKILMIKTQIMINLCSCIVSPSWIKAPTALSAWYLDNKSKTWLPHLHMREYPRLHQWECVCGQRGTQQKQDSFILERSKKGQNEDETDPPLKVLSQSLRVHHNPLVHSRYSTLQSVSVHPLWAWIYTDGSYSGGLESIFPQ